MKRFEWRLQRVLDVKTKEEQKVRSELFVLIQRLAETRGELLRQKKILEQIINDLISHPEKRLVDQEIFLRYSETNDRQIKKLKEKISELEMQQKAKIKEVMKVRKFKEGLEKLRVEAKEQFMKEQSKLEQKQLDEAALVSFNRKTSS